MGSHRAEQFETSYATSPPEAMGWEIGRPQPAFAALAAAGAWTGPLLDVGCGTGEHVLLAAEHGVDATGIDIAPTAIRLAQEKAAARGETVRLLVHDVLDLPSLGGRYATVVDSGLFHTLDPDERPRFVDGLAAVTADGGRYFLLCFSDREPGDWGPRRVTEDELRSSFASGWRIESLEPSTLDVTVRPEPVQAWLLTATRVTT